MASNQNWPKEIRLRKDRRVVDVTFADGSSAALPAEYLRVRSPSAEVQGHSPAERKTVGGKKDVTIVAIIPIGNYAVRLDFDDGHTTGIYSWSYLHELGVHQPRYWAEYLAELEAKGLSREA